MASIRKDADDVDGDNRIDYVRRNEIGRQVKERENKVDMMKQDEDETEAENIGELLDSGMIGSEARKVLAKPEIVLSFHGGV
mmetsp:Transcript_33959/g.55038  ORF Transcript_33959/g.55038 Transcript_33959/m.55038 type:complete len:82 (+) Transcript_33959:240-485(+)